MIATLYNDRIKALATAATGAGHLFEATGSAMRDSPMCGDRVRVDVVVTDGRITELAHDVKGCLLCRAAASVVGLHGVGLSVAEVEALEEAVAAILAGAEAPAGWAELAVFEPVRLHRSRHGCVLLPFEVLALATRLG